MPTTRSGRRTVSRALTLSTNPTEQPQQELRSPPTLLGQPAEILHSIAAELRASGDRRVLSNLCLTSKVLRDVAQVPLFNMFRVLEASEYDIGGTFDELEYDHKVKVNLLRFIRVVFRREKLAAGIVLIDLDFRYIGKPWLLPLEENDKILFSRTYQMLYPQMTNRGAILEHRGLYSILALLFSRLRNLRRMSFGLASIADMRDLFVFLPISELEMRDMFPALEDVSILATQLDDEEWFEGSGQELSEFVRYFAIPTLQKFHIDQLMLDHWPDLCLGSTGNTWRLTHLHLEFCIVVRVEHFVKVILSFSNLEFLKFTAQLEKDSFDDLGYVRPKDFTRAIECHVQSLKYLSIDLIWGNYWDAVASCEERLRNLTIGSMHHFKKMEELNIDSSRVASLCDLPPNLTRLVLRIGSDNYYEWRRSELQEDTERITNFREICPLLREFFIWVADRREMRAWDVSSDMQAVFYDNGSCVSIPDLPYALYICHCRRRQLGQLIEEILSKATQ